MTESKFVIFLFFEEKLSIVLLKVMQLEENLCLTFKALQLGSISHPAL